MDIGLISLIINILLAVFVVYGLLWGVGRGGKKSLVRFIYFIGFVTIFALLSPIIAQALLGIEIPQLGGTLQSFLETKIMEIPEVASVYTSNPALQELIANTPAIIVNLVLFIVLVLLAKFFSWIGYTITWNIHFKNKKPQGKFGDKVYTVKDGKPVVMTAVKEKKYRWAGALIGAVQGFVLMFLLFLPITGVVKTAATYIDTSTTAQSVYAADSVGAQEANTFRYGEISGFLKETLPPEFIEVIGAYTDSIFSKISGFGGFDLLCFDSLSTVTIDGQRVTFRKELNTAADIAESVLYVKNLSEDVTKDWKDLDFDKLETSIESLFDSGLVKSVGMELLTYFLDEAIDGNLLHGSGFDNEAKRMLSDIRDNLEDPNAEMSVTLKNDVLALVGIAKAVCESGLLDAILDEETPITVDIAISKLKTADHNYITDIFTSLFSSTTLQTSIVTSINIGLDKLTEYLTVELEDQGTDVTGANAVVFDRVSKSSIVWTTIATEFSTIADKILEIYSFYNANSEEFDAVSDPSDFAVIMADEDFTPTFLKIGQILDIIQGSELIDGTVGGNDLFTQALTQFNRLNEINDYADLTKLTNLSWAGEMQLVANFFPLVEDMLATTDITTYNFKGIDYTTLSNNIANFFDSVFSEAIKLDAIEEELPTDSEITPMINAILEGKSFVSDLKEDIMPFFNGTFELCKAGLIEYIIAETADDNAEPFSPESVEAFLADIRTVAADQTKSYLTKFIETVLSSDITKYMTAYGINMVLAEFEETEGEYGRVETGATLDAKWANFINSALAVVNKMLLVYDNLVVSDDDPATSDLQLFLDSMDADPIEALLNDNFNATTNGTASLIGQILDSIANLTLWDYIDTVTSDNANIYKNILTKYQTDLEAYVDVDKILDTTSETFWQDELENLAPAIMLLKNTPVDDGDPLTIDDGNLLTKLLDGANVLEFSEFQTLTQTDASITTIISALTHTKIMNSFAIDFFNEINKAIVNLVDDAYDTDYITSEMVLSDQTTTITNVIKTLSAMYDLDIEDFADVLNSTNAPSTQAFLIALQASHTAGGIFDYAYTAINGKVADLMNDINSKVRTMLGEIAPIAPMANDSNDLATDFVNTAKVLSAFEVLKNITPFSFETLFNETNRANTTTLLTELQTNATLFDELEETNGELFESLYYAITGYITNYSGESTTTIGLLKTAIGSNNVDALDWSEIVASAFPG